MALVLFFAARIGLRLLLVGSLRQQAEEAFLFWTCRASVPLGLGRVKESFELGGTRQKKCFQTQRDPAIPAIGLDGHLVT